MLFSSGAGHPDDVSVTDGGETRRHADDTPTGESLKRAAPRMDTPQPSLTSQMLFTNKRPLWKLGSSLSDVWRDMSNALPSAIWCIDRHRVARAAIAGARSAVGIHGAADPKVGDSDARAEGRQGHARDSRALSAGVGADQERWSKGGQRESVQRVYMVVDLKVLDRIVDDDDPEHIKISCGESFFSSRRKSFFCERYG